MTEVADAGLRQAVDRLADEGRQFLAQGSEPFNDKTLPKELRHGAARVTGAIQQLAGDHQRLIQADRDLELARQHAEVDRQYRLAQGQPDQPGHNDQRVAELEAERAALASVHDRQAQILADLDRLEGAAFQAAMPAEPEAAEELRVRTELDDYLAQDGADPDQVLRRLVDDPRYAPVILGRWGQARLHRLYANTADGDPRAADQRYADLRAEAVAALAERGDDRQRAAVRAFRSINDLRKATHAHVGVLDLTSR